MTVVHPPVRRRRRALVLVLLAGVVIWVVVAAVVFARTLPLSRVAAVTSLFSTGQPGFVEVPPVKGTHLSSCSPPCFQPALVVPGPLVYRSPSSQGTQKVLIKYIVQHDGVLGWTSKIVEDQYYDIGVGQPHVRASEKNWLLDTGGHFRVILVVAFTDESGSDLGAQAVLYDQQADYMCETQYPCETGPGWVGVWQP